MNESYPAAMSAPIKPPVLLDEEVATDKWPPPKPRKYEPKPQGMREVLRLCLRKFLVWLKGGESV